MPRISRRDAIRAGAAAAAAATLRHRLQLIGTGTTARAARVAVLREDGFPTADSPPLVAADLAGALAGVETTYLGAAQLDRLAPDAFDVVVTAFGSAFPKAAWLQLLRYLTAGGNWINVGGVPLAVPVVRGDGAWRAEPRQSAYHRRIGITHAVPVDLAGAARLDGPLSRDAGPPHWRRAFAAAYRFARARRIGVEDGSDGAREAVVTPLLSLLDRDGVVVAAPVVRIDRLEGPFAGGRWIFVMLDGGLPAAALATLVREAAAGARQVLVRPSYACYRSGETPSVTVTVTSPGGRPAGGATCALEVRDAGDRVVASTSLSLGTEGFARSGAAELRARRPLAPGLYRVAATIQSPDPATDGQRAETGFWVHDAALLAAGRPFTTDDCSLWRDGRPYPVAGTTYMASDVHRQFLFEPNPAVWDRDFAAMKRQGTTLIRTGIWTGWRRYMGEPGRFDEGALRALDAFMLTARRHEIPVIFTLFAFVPETWGGDNAYLDPAAVAAQLTFVTTIAQRYRAMSDVIWDLINEPSFCNPRHLWSCRPNYDEFERLAWQAWLGEKYPAASDEAHAELLAELWRGTTADDIGLPPLEEFGDRNLWEGSRPLRTTTYRLFAQEMFARWVRRLAGSLKEINPRWLVMVGQDEAGTGESPSSHRFAEHVDLTSIHTWWLNDDLVWDGVVTRVPGLPNLVEETGIMFVETLDGASWRTEQDSRDLLERKLALALGVGGAGYLEWVWNVNGYMPSDNESTIGMNRMDGSARPELEPWRRINAFAAALRDVGAREREPVVMVIPHANLLSSRNQATEATKRCVRAMHYHCRVPMTGVSEFTLGRLGATPRLLISPSPRVLTEEAWRTLLRLAEAGATVLVSGPFEADEYWRPAPRLARWGVAAEVRPVTQAEDLRIGEAIHRLSYRGERTTRVEKAVAGPGGDAVPSVALFEVGRGALLWAPLPVELAHEVEPTVALYRHALAAAGIAPAFDLAGDDPGVLVYPSLYRDAILYTLVSERSRQTALRWTDRLTGARLDVALGPQRAALVLIRRTGGEVLARYQG